MSVSIKFQTRFKELVDETGLKKTILVKQIGIPYQTFAGAYNYGILPKPSSTAKVADYFHVSISYLLGLTENDAPPSEPNPPSDFYTRLDELLRERRLTRYKLAQKCHFDKSSISKWYSQKQIPNWEILDILTDHFKVSHDYLLGRTDERKSNE